MIFNRDMDGCAWEHQDYEVVPLTILIDIWEEKKATHH